MTEIEYYFDEMMNRSAAEQLSQRGYKVTMANDVGMTEKTDPEHLTYATEHGLVLVTLDRRFAMKAAEDTNHAGLICWTGAFQNVGAILRALSQFADTHTAAETAGQVFWLK